MNSNQILKRVNHFLILFSFHLGHLRCPSQWLAIIDSSPNDASAIERKKQKKRSTAQALIEMGCFWLFSTHEASN